MPRSYAGKAPGDGYSARWAARGRRCTLADLSPSRELVLHASEPGESGLGTRGGILPAGRIQVFVVLQLSVRALWALSLVCGPSASHLPATHLSLPHLRARLAAVRGELF